MNNSVSIRFLVAFLLCFFMNSVFSEANRLSSCQSAQGASGYPQLQRVPRRVLIVPLLSWDSDAGQVEKWTEKPAQSIAAFYRNRFNADVKRLRDVWSWTDYYRKVEQLLAQSPPFDRVIFIGHGGFDGPILDYKVFWQDLMITGVNGELLVLSESQPGLKNVVSVIYNINKNKIFTDYMAAHWLELAQMQQGDIWHQLKGLVKQIQPLDSACFNRYCAADKLATTPKEIYENRIDICELICRESLFDLKSTTEISQERFSLFTNSLRSSVTADGLIFFGACNPGSAAPEKVSRTTRTEKLINSTLAGGPYNSYVHLISAVTGRVTAGPIGNSSAEDIVNRIILFESNRPQRYLCVVAPASP